MKTTIRKTNDTVIVEVAGRIDFEAQKPLRDNLERVFDQMNDEKAPYKVIFNFEDLDFVGSSGITSFIQTLKELGSHAPRRPKYACVKSEFQRLMKAFDQDEGFEFYDNVERARKSFDQ